jgi:hypothetical protein
MIRNIGTLHRDLIAPSARPPLEVEGRVVDPEYGMAWLNAGFRHCRSGASLFSC